MELQKNGSRAESLIAPGIGLTMLRKRAALFDDLLRMAVTRAQNLGFQQGEYQGLFVDDVEVNRHLSAEPGIGLWGMSTLNFDLPAWREQYRARRAALADDERAHGAPFAHLMAEFGLTDDDADLLMAALAPEFERRYERLYSYLQDDVTRRRPTAEFGISLLADSLEGRALLSSRLLPGAPLIDYDLISVLPDSGQREPTFLSHFLKADIRVVNFLLGLPIMDSRLNGVVTIHYPDQVRPETALAITDRADWDRIAAALPLNPVFYFYGTYGAGMVEAALAVCAAAGQRVVHVDLARLKTLGGADGLERFVKLALRESRLFGCPVILDNWAAMLDERHNVALWLVRAIVAHPEAVFMIGSEAWEPHLMDRERPILRREFATPEVDDRIAFWRTYLGEPAADPTEVAIKFRLTGGQIRDAARTARDLAAWRGEAHPTAADLYAGARAQSNRKLSNLAQKIEPRYSWKSIILPEDHIQQLHEIVNQVNFAHQVYNKWGFRGRAKNVQGITALFAGESGTGKTMSADVIAYELGLDLYRIDLSTVVSKYIGETEKNLGAIFDEASQSNAILFFDEADSLFGKRSEVKDSHDRYANIETGYLLQRMETYSGVAILATNRLQDLDKAFIRRLDIVITFPTAEKSDRAAIWRVTFPPDAPLAPDVDFDDLARRFKQLAGGNIRNVVTTSAFVAASEGEPLIALRHIEHAIKREYQKMSKLVE
jgi:AAA+ superfamily predicted ATPase